MHKYLLLILLGFCQLSLAQDAETQDVSDADSQDAAQEDGGDLVAAEITETNDEEEESSTRFIPTEEISQDLGVSFPIDI